VQRRINKSDLDFGQALAWDLTNAGGQVVLRRGEALQDTGQLESLLQAGLFLSIPDLEDISVLRTLNQIDKRLERLFAAIGSNTDAQGELQQIAQSLILATDANPDIAIACILLNQIAGNYAVRHCIETAILAARVAQALGISGHERLCIACAALTMNLGMLRHQEQMQQRNSLSTEESQMIRRHPEESANLLRHAGVEDHDWLGFVLAHHESEDGNGYPFGKGGDEIPQGAKIIALADRYCAFVSARNYRKSLLPDKALQEAFYNPQHAVPGELAAEFIRQLGPFPPGSYVRLKNGEIGVVSARPQGQHACIVHVLISEKGIPLLPDPIAREAAGPIFDIREALGEDDAAIRFGMKQIWGRQAAL
jgi:HD-GYP domain-containing protein (c-di-GMP phosphodiesterase class II)